MQIHELNDFTGTLGSGAYLAIDNGTDTGKISSEGLLAATEARIDNIIAGPAPSAEEIVDARLGDDGVTYPSLGDAIRSQVTNLDGDIDRNKYIADLYSSLFSLMQTDFAAGTYIDCDITKIGIYKGSSTRAYTMQYIASIIGCKVVINQSNPDYQHVFFVNNSASGSYVTGTAEYTPSADLLLSIGFRRTDNTALSDADLSAIMAGLTIKYYPQPLTSIIDDSVNALIDVSLNDYTYNDVFEEKNGTALASSGGREDLCTFNADGSITIAPGGYYFVAFNVADGSAGNTLIRIKSDSSDHFSIRNGAAPDGSSQGSVTITTETIAPGTEYAIISKSMHEEGYPYYQIRIDNRYNLTNLNLYSLEVYSVHISGDAHKPTAYVSPTGNDDNDGSQLSPFATISHAINSGYKNICVIAGEYTESLNFSNVDNLNIFANNNDSYLPQKRARPVFTNGTKFTSFLTDGSGYKYFALSEVPANYTGVFINHTLDPITTGTRPSYNAGLWANHDNKYDDFKVKPVLTYAELTEDNTFYFDGDYVYFNIPSVINGVTVVNNTLTGFNFVNCNNLSLSGLAIKYAFTQNLTIAKSNNVDIKDCEFGYTMMSDCVSANYSNVRFENCESYKARNDGFNSHYYGISVFENCKGLYNYDDGESSHEDCEVFVHGGEWAHNGKGGHSPVNGCKFICDGTYTHDNNFGFYLVGNNLYLQDEILISNSVAKDNTISDLRNDVYTTKLWNNIIGTINVNSGTVIDLSN